MHVVVRANSTRGMWVVEETTRSKLSESKAEVAHVGSKEECEAEAIWLNQREAGLRNEDVSPNGHEHIFYDE